MKSHTTKDQCPEGIELEPSLTTRERIKSSPSPLLPYNYSALDGPDRIRLMRLHPTKARIECSIQQVDLAAGDYQALSYVWGSADKPFCAVVVNETNNELGYIPLSTNLQHALCDLRDSEDVAGNVFWIDQICINQEGDEKSHQVAMMGQIYQHALRVITYVGSASASEEAEERGIKLLMRLYDHYSSVHEIVFNASSLYDALFRKKEFPVDELPKDLQESIVGTQYQRNYEDRGWKWLLQVAYGEWTKRLWIVQEQVLCQEIALLCGPRLISWDAVTAIPILFYLELLPSHYLIHFWKEKYSASPLVPNNITDSVYYRQQGRQKMKRGMAVQTYGLLDNMVWHEDLECQDPRDRIFALLGVSTDAAQLDITTDYSDKSNTSSIFINASISILHTSTNLHMLIHACRWAGSKVALEIPSPSLETNTISKFPSWALRPPGHLVPAYFVSDAYTPHPIRAYKISHLNPESPILALKGHFVDRISMATPLTFLSQSGYLGAIDEQWIQSILDILSNWLAVIYHLGITLENVARLCSTIVASPSWTPSHYIEYSIITSTAFHLWSYYRCIVNDMRKHTSLLAIGMKRKIERCEQFLSDLALLLTDIINLDSFCPDAPCSPEEETASAHLSQHCLTHGRSFCTTEGGHTCNAMNQAREGDRVATLQGSDRLFILRQAGDKYRLIGEAYVDGLMFGEAYEGVSPDDLDNVIEVV